jgi:uncharacterized protein (TIGR04141 family)
MPKSEKKSYKLSIYLLKNDIKNYRDALKEEITIQAELEFKEEINAEGKVIIGATKQSTSSWRELIQEGVNPPLPDLENTSNRAIVFFKIDNRIFALVFGYGKHLIKEEAIDREFGLRTVLNIIDPEKLLSVDKANLDELTTLTRTQTSRKSSLETFEVDKIRNLLKGVTGVPSTDFTLSIGKLISGSEGIHILPKIKFKDIPEGLKALKQAYEDTSYKARFAWIDNVRSERNLVTIDHLRENLVNSLKSRDNLFVHLSLPDIIDWESYAGFSYTRNGEQFSDFDIEDFYSERADSLEELNWNKLVNLVLYFNSTESGEVVTKPFWRFINYQTEYKGSIYVFALSKWYKINKNYATEILEYAQKINESSLTFIDCKDSYKEDNYNKALSDSSNSYYLFDKDFVASSYTGSKIEACDVYSDTGEFIHVKVRHSSAALSHLFAQGKISAYSLKKDEKFRDNFNKKLEKKRLKNRLIPTKADEFMPGKYIITYAIIEKRERSFVESLPFFSLLNFRLTAEEIIDLGFEVRVKKIIKK